MSELAWSSKWIEYAQQLGLRGAAQQTAVALATYADTDGIAWPSVETLILGTGLSDSAQRRGLHELVGLGVLTCERGGGRSKTSNLRYTLEPPRAPTPELAKLFYDPEKRVVEMSAQRSPGE